MKKAWIFDIQRFSTHDGPGIRTTVFFKGCPLQCLWCCNPESQGFKPELFYLDSICIRCLRCLVVCPHGATKLNGDGGIAIDRKLCRACGTCVAGCPSGARFISGRQVTVAELMEAARKDALFYRNSGGGVTASGGEATWQAGFLEEFLRGCQADGFHTVLDTCGYVKWELLERILTWVELVLFDIKHMDPQIHRQLTGVDNALILDNARRIARAKKPMIIRVPLIPGGNDSPENLAELAKFVLELGAPGVELLPYHQLGVRKYAQLGKSYPMSYAVAFSEIEVTTIARNMERHGLEVKLG